MLRLGRTAQPPPDLLDGASIATATAMAGTGLRLLIDATGSCMAADHRLGNINLR